MKEKHSLYWQPNVTDVWHVFSQMLWKSWTYLVSDQVQTEAGPFVTPLSLQAVHKNEPLGLEK